MALPRKGATITLTHEQMATAINVGTQRQENNEREGRRDNRVLPGAVSRAQDHIDGVVAEIAGAALCGVEPILSVHVRTGRNDPGDFIVAGFQVDAKRAPASLRTPHLLIPCHLAESPNEIYVLITGEGATMKFRGAIHRSRAIHDWRIDETQREPCYSIPLMDLGHMDDVIAEARGEPTAEPPTTVTAAHTPPVWPPPLPVVPGGYIFDVAHQSDRDVHFACSCHAVHVGNGVWVPKPGPWCDYHGPDSQLHRDRDGHGDLELI